MSPRLLPYQVILIDIELIADVFVDFPVWKEDETSLECVRSGEGFGILQRALHLDMPEFGTAVPLDDMQLIAVRRALTAEPGFVVESDRVDHQRVAIPFRNGVTHPERVHILRMNTPIEKQLSI